MTENGKKITSLFLAVLISLPKTLLTLFILIITFFNQKKKGKKKRMEEKEKLWKTISRNYLSLLEDKDTCDVTITVGSGEEIKIFYAHSLILRTQTPYFQTALSIHWGKMKDGKIVLEKPNISPDVFNDILR